MFKIDKTLVDNMNINRSFIVITHRETEDSLQNSEDMALGGSSLLDGDTQMPQAVRDRAREMIQSAQVKAQQTTQAAAARSEEIREEARQEGYNTGLLDAEKRITEMMDAKNKEARTLIREVSGYRDGLYDELQESVLGLALDIAEKIININLEKDDRTYREIAKKAVLGLKQSDDFMLRVSRGEFERYFKDGGQWLREETDCGDFEVVCDPGMGPGGLVIESDNEIVNAGVEMQLEKTRQYLEEQVE